MMHSPTRTCSQLDDLVLTQVMLIHADSTWPYSLPLSMLNELAVGIPLPIFQLCVTMVRNLSFETWPRWCTWGKGYVQIC